MVDQPVTDDNLPPDSIINQAKGDWRRTYAHWRKWRAESKEDYNFAAGDQWDAEDKLFLDRQGRPAVTFNRIAPMLDAVAGAEITNRQQVSFIPRELGDSAVNEALTAAAKYFRDECDAEDEESAAFFDCLVCGVGWTETRLDFDEDQDGTIKIERVDPFEVFVDPAAQKGNFADARYIFRVKDLTRAEVVHEWGEDAVSNLLPGSFAWGDVTEEDEDPHHTLHGRQYERGEHKSGGETRRRRYRVVEYQWKDWEPVYRMLDPKTGSDVTFNAERFAKLRKMFDAVSGKGSTQTMIDSGAIVKQKRLEVRRAFFLGDQTLEEGPGPCRTDFTYRSITGKRHRNKHSYFGLVRAMKDPQRWSNKFFSQILHIINSNAKGGLLAEMDAFDDPRDAETRWAEADSIIWMKPGGSAKVQPKPYNGVPPDTVNMMMFCAQSLRDVTGINLEMLGMAEAVQPGVLEYQRRQSGLIILGTLFNNLRRYRKEQGRLLLYFIQEYIPEGRLIRIEGSTGAQYVPLMKQQDVGQFDVIVDEAPSSPNLKEQVFAVMQIIVPQLMAMGIKVPSEALDYLPLPDSLVKAIRQANEPQPGQEPPPDPTMAAVQAQIQADMFKAQGDHQIKQAQLQSDHQLQMQKLASDAEVKRQQLQMERQSADVEAQVAAGKLQLEHLKLQAMLNKPTPDAAPQMDESVSQLAQTVAENHARMQNALGAVVDNVGELFDHMKAQQAHQSNLHQMMQRLAAPRRIIRDKFGRVTGSELVPTSGAMGEPPVMGEEPTPPPTLALNPNPKAKSPVVAKVKPSPIPKAKPSNGSAKLGA